MEGMQIQQGEQEKEELARCSGKWGERGSV